MNNVPYWLREFAEKTESLRNKNKQMAEETKRMGEEIAKLGEQIKKLKELDISQLIKKSIKPQYLEIFSTTEEAERYCIECGSENLAYEDSYANGYEWQCRDCGNMFIW